MREQSGHLRLFNVPELSTAGRAFGEVPVPLARSFGRIWLQLIPDIMTSCEPQVAVLVDGLLASWVFEKVHMYDIHLQPCW